MCRTQISTNLTVTINIFGLLNYVEKNFEFCYLYIKIKSDFCDMNILADGMIERPRLYQMKMCFTPLDFCIQVGLMIGNRLISRTRTYYNFVKMLVSRLSNIFHTIKHRKIGGSTLAQNGELSTRGNLCLIQRKFYHQDREFSTSHEIQI